MTMVPAGRPDSARMTPRRGALREDHDRALVVAEALGQAAGGRLGGVAAEVEHHDVAG